jgi:uncharacterized membrane protein YhaH (DUF805 family)
MLPYLVIVGMTQLVILVAGEDSSLYVGAQIFDTIFYLLILWPSIAVLVKRIHDRNRSAWMILFLFVPGVLFVSMLFIWMGAAFFALGQGQSLTIGSPVGVLGGLVIVSGVVLLGVNIWFFVEFGCLRGTIGSNRFGPDPVR